VPPGVAGLKLGAMPPGAVELTEGTPGTCPIEAVISLLISMAGGSVQLLVKSFGGFGSGIELIFI
jgi:hypothetical protein